MTPSSIEPRPCRDSGCRGDHDPAERVALAASLCRERGTQLTATRQRVLEILWESGRPTGAYQLIDTLEQEASRPIGPPTVYRALDFLMAQGLVAKIESRNAYVACVHPERSHDCLFFICRDCGATAEMEDPRIGQLLVEHATVVGYRIARHVVEVEGMCPDCVAADGLQEKQA